jgi:hypothetical protein
VFRRVDAHCTDTAYGHCPGGQYANGNSDETKCDGAPVYQRAGEGGGVDGSGPVLYRGYYGNGHTIWDVGSSARLADCYRGNGDYHYLASGSIPGPTGGAPTAPGYSAGDGWYDGDNNGARGTISVSAGGGGGGGGGH